MNSSLFTRKRRSCHPEPRSLWRGEGPAVVHIGDFASNNRLEQVSPDSAFCNSEYPAASLRSRGLQCARVSAGRRRQNHGVSERQRIGGCAALPPRHQSTRNPPCEKHRTTRGWPAEYFAQRSHCRLQMQAAGYRHGRDLVAVRFHDGLQLANAFRVGAF